MKLKAILFIGLLLTVFNQSQAQLTQHEAIAVDDFGKLITAQLAADDLHAGMSVALVKGDKLIWSKAFGYLRADGSTPADTSTVYRIGSITKTFTSTLMMILVEDGKISLDDPVEKYVPEVKKIKGYGDDTRFTLRELASHTAGLAREPDISGANVGVTEKWQKRALDCIPKATFIGKPAQQYLYSNIGVAILGLALERAAGEPYIDMVEQRIIKPLHMTSTFFVLPRDKRNLLAQGIANNEENISKTNLKLPAEEIEGRGYRVPNGGLFSTPTDLAKFAASMMKGQHLLKPESLLQMRLIPPGGKNYGFGLMVNTKRNIIAHDGSVAGYTAMMMIDQNKGYAVILMRNNNFGSTNLNKAASDLLLSL